MAQWLRRHRAHSNSGRNKVRASADDGLRSASEAHSACRQAKSILLLMVVVSSVLAIAEQS